MQSRKKPQANLRRRYTTTIQLGLIASLGMLILAFRAPWAISPVQEIMFIVDEPIAFEEMVPTQHFKKPPPPPRPIQPIVIDDESILEEDALSFDAILDVDVPLTAPPIPPEQPEESQTADPPFFVIVEQMPELIGGLGELQSKIKYPEIAKKAGVEVRVFVQFIVDEQGNVVNPEVARGIGAGCDEEALRAIRTAKFKPGKQRGQAVRVKMSLPITFKLK